MTQEGEDKSAAELAIRSSMPAVLEPPGRQQAQISRAEALEALKAQMAALRLPPAVG